MKISLKKKSVLIIGSVLLFLLALLNFNNLKKYSTYLVISRKLDPKIISIVKDLKIDSSDIDSLINAARKYPIDECDPNLYDCDKFPPTKEELGAQYIRIAYSDPGMIHQLELDKFRHYLLQSFQKDGAYNYNNSGLNSNGNLWINFVSDDGRKYMGLEIERVNDRQEIVTFQTWQNDVN